MDKGKGINKKSTRATEHYREGRSRGAYCLRSDIYKGLNSNVDSQKREGGNLADGGVCASCKGLTNLRDIFDSFISSGSALKKHMKAYSKPDGSVYRKIKEQNNFLLKTIFDVKGNYVYHCNCIRNAFGVGTACLIGSYSQDCSATILETIFASRK